MYSNYLKRFFDLIISIFIIVIFLPIFIIIFLILFVQNSGEVFFIQTRIGKMNKEFGLIKFRSMNNKKDDQGNLLKDMDRITPFGHFIRKASLDELPQIFNILKGEMSLVGPRPLLSEYLPYYSEYHIRRHEIKPGITGLAQIEGRNYLKFSERFNLDVHYVDNVSLKLDLQILVKTFFKIFKSSDISMGRKMSEIDDIGITKGLAKHYFNIDENE
ncbi:sugar transferase [Flavobacterium alkalisoli]|uniref:Sugar transferase n=1 Tax=Flavobacterium alkalisoli TaxID=2602769 RepID=A0A5B9FR70_9FLAO|nr:sugar transferase [Flavobacterium alkalisoli]QEE49464.1 sugar transferase [Flavobacterium alkalisoli]